MISGKKEMKVGFVSSLLACLLFFSVPLAVSFQVSALNQNQVSILSSATSSLNWAGYVVASGQTPTKTVTAVYGSWILQPVRTSAGSKYSAQWIGIGGFFSGDKSLIQTGSESNSGGGKSTYGVWYEILPAGQTKISEPVNAGDTIQASVVCVSACTSATQSWTITLKDNTQGWTFTKTLSYSSSLKSAEWIEERPALCVLIFCKLTTLASFGTASYGQLYTSVSGTGFATISGTTASIGSFTYSEVTMTKSGGTVIAQPSILSVDGSSFTVKGPA
jgi:hypothetical protein